jgi:hypothetical protein
VPVPPLRSGSSPGNLYLQIGLAVNVTPRDDHYRDTRLGGVLQAAANQRSAAAPRRRVARRGRSQTSDEGASVYHGGAGVATPSHGVNGRVRVEVPARKFVKTLRPRHNPTDATFSAPRGGMVRTCKVPRQSCHALPVSAQ